MKDLKITHSGPSDGTIQTRRSAFLFSEALKLYEAVISNNPENIEAFYYRGLLFGKTGNHQAALTSLSRCLELDPNFRPALYETACAKHRLGNSYLGLLEALKLKEMDPSYPGLEGCLGALNFSLGRFQRSQSAFLNVVEAKRGDELYALYGRGLSLLRMRVLTKAKECFLSILQMHPKKTLCKQHTLKKHVCQLYPHCP